VVQAQSQKLRLRELDIVDEKGRERIVIAAPLPEAVVDGKVGRRGSRGLGGSSIQSPEW
jgi:hypothetical protein